MNGSLTAATGTDYDLYLDLYYGGVWYIYAYSVTDKTSNETISYSVPSGYSYRWRVVSWTGTGAYTLCTKTP